MHFSDEIIEVCTKCHGLKPCWCSEEEDKEYIYMERWIYDLIKQLKPM